MAMYIRVKRNKTTYFLQCDPTDKVLQIKEKLQTLIDQPVTDQRLILMPVEKVLDDSKTLADQQVENDAVVALTLRKVSELLLIKEFVEFSLEETLDEIEFLTIEAASIVNFESFVIADF
ncbi:hypothetical protein LIER_27535 [Lithospermum erythrorhizon]|uniref:Ubiquitin-like domain-containing protein n=1 Tax=Lithospermum erythrorhizon TaxID=34254 RepID=A0AAV3RE40_LITER